jgi:hypothetical protein
VDVRDAVEARGVKLSPLLFFMTVASGNTDGRNVGSSFLSSGGSIRLP